MTDCPAENRNSVPYRTVPYRSTAQHAAQPGKTDYHPKQKTKTILAKAQRTRLPDRIYLESFPLKNSHPNPPQPWKLSPPPPRHPSPKHLSRPILSPLSTTSSFHCSSATLSASFILLDNRSLPFTAPSGAFARRGKGEPHRYIHPSIHPYPAGSRDTSGKKHHSRQISQQHRCRQTSQSDNDIISFPTCDSSPTTRPKGAIAR